MPHPVDGPPRTRSHAAFSTSSRRVRDLVRSAIADGSVRPDEQLVEHFLIREMACSRREVREALQALADEGIVRRLPRTGTTVVRPPISVPLDDVVDRMGPQHWRVRRLTDRRVPSTALIRARLRTDAAVVGAVEHLFTVDGEVVGVRLAYYGADVVQPDGWATCPDMRTAFEAVHGCVLGAVTTRLDAFASDPRTSELLRTPVGSPTLVREQTFHDEAGVPHEFAYSYYPSSRVSFVAASTDGRAESPTG